MSCKWNYLGHLRGGRAWDADGFLRPLGLLPLLRRGMAGESVVPLGRPVGSLLDGPAKELGLVPGIPVASGIIDAHAGGVGLLRLAQGGWNSAGGYDSVMALIGGTSSCHMAISKKPRFVPGVWGPYFGAMVPVFW